ncbi:MAG: hypothetical protein V4858_06020 [Pseudomonadota bacterium]
MSEKTSHKEIAVSTSDEIEPPLVQFSDVYRRQLALISETTDALLRGSAAMQGIQRQAAHDSAQRLENAAQKLNGDYSPSDILATQVAYWTTDPGIAGNYWRDMTNAAWQAQSDLLRCSATLFKDQSSGLLKTVMDTWHAMSKNAFNAHPAAT